MYWRSCLPVLGAFVAFLSPGSKTPALAGATCDQLAAQANQTFAQINNVPFNAPPGGVNVTDNRTLGFGGDLAPGEVLIFQVIPGPNFAGVTNATSDVSAGLAINGNPVFQFRTKVATTREFTIPAGATFPATVLFAVLNFENAVTLSAELRLGCRNSIGGVVVPPVVPPVVPGTGDGSGLTQSEKSQTIDNLINTTQQLNIFDAGTDTGKDKAVVLLNLPKFKDDPFARVRRLELRIDAIEEQIESAQGRIRSAKRQIEEIDELTTQVSVPTLQIGPDGNLFRPKRPIASQVEKNEELRHFKNTIEAREAELKQLNEKLAITIEDLKAAKFEATGVRSLTDDLQGVISIAGFKVRANANGHIPDIDIDIDRALGLGDNLKFDLWLKGAATFLNDSSAADRDGYGLRFTLGGAYRLSDNFAVSAQVFGGPGRIDINATNSQTKFKSYGLSMSGVMRFGDKLFGSLTGFVERADHDIKFGPVSGSFDQNTYGLSADLSGRFQVKTLWFDPSATIQFQRSDRNGFTDSGGTFIAGKKSNFGRISAGTKIGRAFEGDGVLSLFKPYVSGRIHYDFRNQKSFNIGQGIVVNDSRFNGEVGAGVDAYFIRGILSRVSVNYFGVGSNNLSALSVNGSLNVPF